MGPVINFIMQQKNKFQQDHLDIQRQTSVTLMKTFTTKFFSDLNRTSPSAPGEKTKERRACSRADQASRTQGSDCGSTSSQLDHEDLLFLSQFQQNTKKSSFTDIFPLTANYKQINYTDSIVLSQDNNSTLNEESFLESVDLSLSAQEERRGEDGEVRRGEIRFDNGAYFRGETRAGKMALGTFILEHVFTYKGEFSMDRFHGRGILCLSKGHTITCEWNQGRPVGNVIINYPYGQRYEGEIDNFKKNGVGCLYFKDGSRYVGQFEEDNITGQGCYFSAEGEEHRGYWLNGQYLGQVNYKSFTSKKFSKELICVRKGSQRKEKKSKKIQLQ